MELHPPDVVTSVTKAGRCPPRSRKPGRRQRRPMKGFLKIAAQLDLEILAARDHAQQHPESMPACWKRRFEVRKRENSWRSKARDTTIAYSHRTELGLYTGSLAPGFGATGRQNGVRPGSRGWCELDRRAWATAARHFVIQHLSRRCLNVLGWNRAVVPVRSPWRQLSQRSVLCVRVGLDWVRLPLPPASVP